MAGLIPAGLSSLLPKDHKLTVSLLVAGAGALALALEYYRYREKHGICSKNHDDVPEVSSKIISGNEKLEEAIRYYESALVDMQRQGADTAQRMQIRAMLLRAYEIQAILSPDEFNLRSSVMIEGRSSACIVKNVIEDSILELDAPSIAKLQELRDRSDSVSSGLSDFYEAFDTLSDSQDEADGTLPAFYKDQLFMHKVKEVKCRTNRHELVQVLSPTEYLIKVQCIRLAMDRILCNSDRAQYMLDIGRDNTTKLLDVAGADSGAFGAVYDKVVQYVSDTENMAAIKEELAGRRVPCFNMYDVVIDFCLLDSFDDLDMPPGAIVSVLQNTWISQGVRRTMLSSAVWGMISTKSRKTNPGGFLRHFYEVMGTLSPSLAWGFLGDDPVLHPICLFIRESVTQALIKVFDHTQTDFSSLDNLADDLFRTLQLATDELSLRLDNALQV